MKTFPLSLPWFMTLCAGAVAQQENMVYTVYYPSSSEQEQQCLPGSAVGIHGWVSNNTSTVLGGRGATCAEEMACLLDSTSEECLALDRTAEGAALFVVDPNGTGTYECDASNLGIGLEECMTFGGCEPSSIYPHCEFDLVSPADLKSNPQILANDEPSAAGVNDYAYGVFYSDAECTDFAGLKGFVSKTPYTITYTGDDVSCHDAMACLVQPDGKACAALGANSSHFASLILQTRGDNGEDVFLCDSSNEAIGEATCELLHPETCIQSSVMSNCHFRTVSAYSLAMHPDFIVGILPDSSASTPSPSSGIDEGGNEPAPAPTEPAPAPTEPAATNPPSGGVFMTVSAVAVAVVHVAVFLVASGM